MASYIDKPDTRLRFGDVVTGFQLAAPHMDLPGGAKTIDFTIRLTQPDYFIVMTPCCSIENQCFSLAPLTHIRPAFFSIPYFAEDLMRINRPLEAEKAVPPERWERMNTEERSAVIAKGICYTFFDCFVYGPHEVFGSYTLKKGKSEWSNVRHWLVDFKSIFRVNCSGVNRNADAPSGIKVLELTVDSRASLRDKLTQFFARNADANPE